MIFNKHLMPEGAHAFLGASKYHWVNYDEQKLDDVYAKYRAAQRGTELHDLAAKMIKLRRKQIRNHDTINMYVNDAIGFKMTTEQCLYYSENCFGTADCISFRDKLLRIHDLKTGASPASIKQLEIYAALFCLEYREDPNDIGIELRLYQSEEVLVHNPEPEDILYIMQKIKDFDKRINLLKQGE